MDRLIYDMSLCVIVEKLMNLLNTLLHCENNVEDRTVMIDTVKDLAVSKNPRRSLRITEGLLLAPTCDDVSKRDMMSIKEALFEFISSCNRNI